jgi:hypothetical protein
MACGTIICILPDARAARVSRGRKTIDKLLTAEDKM